ncbi:MAG: hypothetical protein JWO37_1834 [Acidimicrobiales bacterium]|nr:hypothetical protein [Acidimicrobiales bacterium]
MTSTAPGTLLPPGSREDPEGLLRRLELSVTMRLDGLLQGDYRGLVPGPGTEADEARPYEPGDDVRRIDWPLTARSGATYVRNTIADRELETWAVVDGSASMEFGTAICKKRDLAIAAVAALGFMTARGGNRIGAMVLDGGRPRIVPPRSGRQSLMALLHTVATRSATDDGTSVDLAEGIRRAGHAARRAGLVAVISDFLCPSRWADALRTVRARSQVIAVEVIDPRELELPSVGYLTLVDPETGRTRDVHTKSESLRSRYAAAAAAQRQANATAIKKAGAAHLVLRTDRDWVLDTATFIKTTRRVGSDRNR